MTEGRAPTRRWIRVAARVVVSGVVLVVLARALDARAVTERLRDAGSGWILAALLVSVGQVLVSAWRWRFTAGQLGIRLPFGEAVREYYLATFLNQVLPGGVLGDVSRAWRQAREEVSGGPAARSVLLERASGQFFMLAWAGACGAILLLRHAPAEFAAWPFVPAVTVGTLVGGVVVTGIVLRGVPWSRLPGTRKSGALDIPGFTPSTETGRGASSTHARGGSTIRRLLEDTWAEARRALLHRRAFPVQAVTSVLVVGSYVVVFILACRAVGIDTSPGTLSLLIPPVLVAMLIPVTLAGWGLREGTAALLWAAVGLPAAEGTAASVLYGLLVLVSSLPGALVLLWVILRQTVSGRDPDRRGRPGRGERADRGDGGLRPGSPREAA